MYSPRQISISIGVSAPTLVCKIHKGRLTTNHVRYYTSADFTEIIEQYVKKLTLHRLNFSLKEYCSSQEMAQFLNIPINSFHNLVYRKSIPVKGINPNYIQRVNFRYSPASKIYDASQLIELISEFLERFEFIARRIDRVKSEMWEINPLPRRQAYILRLLTKNVSIVNKHYV